MRALRTIVATAVIVFTLTTVAMAGVQHYTRQNDQSGGARAQAIQSAPPTYTITMTAAQLKALMGAQGGATKANAGAQHIRHQDKARETDHSATRTTTRSSWTGPASGSTRGGSGSDTSNCNDYDHHGDASGDSHDGDHHSGDQGCW
jgi:hypothetical protein